MEMRLLAALLAWLLLLPVLRDLRALLPLLLEKFFAPVPLHE